MSLEKKTTTTHTMNTDNDCISTSTGGKCTSTRGSGSNSGDDNNGVNGVDGFAANTSQIIYEQMQHVAVYEFGIMEKYFEAKHDEWMRHSKK
jgi:hypothetical protein